MSLKKMLTVVLALCVVATLASCQPTAMGLDNGTVGSQVNL